MKQYLDLLKLVLRTGEVRTDRTGTGTIGIFGHRMEFNLANGFPIVTTKKIHLRSVFGELAWFLRGQTNTKYLKDNNIRIWDEWADENGDLGPIYGKQWRSWGTKGFDNIDQIANIIKSIKENPFSRRHIVSAWNVGELDEMALVPCHVMFQFYVSNDNKLSLQLYQRSADIFLGMPFNIASYSALLYVIAQITGYLPGKFIYTTGDTHIYLNHLEQVKQQLKREPKTLPSLKISPIIKNISDLNLIDIEDFIVSNYEYHPLIRGEVSV